MTRFALTLEFDGGPFMGLQKQPHGPSVQEAVETAAQGITGEDVTMHAAGRTDTGVHALAMRAHIDVQKDITAFRLKEGLNAKLRPDPIAVIDCQEVSDDWHARFTCIGRDYEYRILNRRAPPALEQGRVWHEPRPLDADAMHDAAQVLVGQHDFTTFRSVQCQAKSPLKTLDRLDVRRASDSLAGEHVIIEACARSFLHHQVRSMVGCLALVGLGKWTKTDLADALAACDRNELGLNAPPDGLFFVRARYPDEEN